MTIVRAVDQEIMKTVRVADLETMTIVRADSETTTIVRADSETMTIVRVDSETMTKEANLKFRS